MTDRAARAVLNQAQTIQDMRDDGEARVRAYWLKRGSRQRDKVVSTLHATIYHRDLTIKKLNTFVPKGRSMAGRM